jgi:hypothetical protein
MISVAALPSILLAARSWIAVPTCRNSDDQSAFLLGALGEIVSLTDSTSVRLRSALQVPQMSASSVSLVTQAQTCSKAAAGLDVAQDTVISNRTMYVFKLGTTRFAVYEVNTEAPSSNAQFDRSEVYYFTNKWAFLSVGKI